MNGKNKTLLLVTVALLISNGVLLYLYLNKKSSRHGPHDRRAMMTEMLKKEVGFNQQQLARFEQLREAHMAATRPLFDSMRSAREALFNQMGSRPATDSALHPYLQHIARLQQQLDLQVFGNMAEIRRLCTAPQLPKFDSLAKKMMLRMSGGRRMGAPAKPVEPPSKP